MGMKESVFFAIALTVLLLPIISQIDARHEARLRDLGIGYNDFDNNGITCATSDFQEDARVRMMEETKALIADTEKMLSSVDPNIIAPSTPDTPPPSVQHRAATDDYVQSIRDCEAKERQSGNAEHGPGMEE